MPKIASESLTAKSVEKLRAKTSRYDVYDARVRGLGVRVSTAGTKTWFAMRRVNQRMVRASIGRYPTMSLAEARSAASQLIAKMDSGTHPRSKTVETTADAYGDWIEKDQRDRRRKRNVELAMEKHVLPYIGRRRLASVQRADINAVLDRVVAGGAPIQANRVLAYTRRFFNWCVEQDLLEGSPCQGVKPRAKEVSRDRVLSVPELRAVWQAASVMEYPFGPMIQMLILTGQRLVEVSGACWPEIAIDEHVWRLPATRTKNGRPHVVHLAGPTRDVVLSLSHVIDIPWLFSTTGRSPVSGFSKAKKRLDDLSCVTGWQIHDLRRTFATHATETLGASPVVVDKVLNHVSGAVKGVAAVYQRGEYLTERRTILEQWAEFVIHTSDAIKSEK